MISNHGVRPLEDVAALIRQLPRIREAVRSTVQVIVNSGMPRGIDFLRALALGDDACTSGRPYL
jgi:(S)-mandelate dehydrogenase